ncbi:copper resistance protein NlpE [Hufsiella ginkgonis]|uniref:Uncharacterized protein n=1 Tax=Hufsiella ginkgonis TaxID=2695274 RepID=A0A7K1Y406_9SPHI|nr:copper resistance protein NlpE [Hufsiella ginkgonis]MXV18005.1 hypothetical protein [Hufsiella ginkgonis]
MSKNILWLSMVLFASCTASKGLVGNYARAGKDFKYTLTINQDSTFALTKQYFEASSKCQGRWSYISKDTLILKCDAEKFPAAIAGGYMQDREQKVVLLANGKLMLQSVTLKKTK